MSGKRMSDEFSVFRFHLSVCHTPSGALLPVPLTQRDKVARHLKPETRLPALPLRHKEHMLRRTEHTPTPLCTP